jgi:hypothetical protein
MNIMLGGTVTTLPESLRGPFEDFSQKVNSTDGAEWEGAFKKFLRKEPCWVNGDAKSVVSTEPKSQPVLLIPIGTTTVAATTTLFVARDRFVVNTGKKAPVKISDLGGNFKDWFLEKVEQPFVGSTLKYGKLSRSSVDGPILAELGGEAEAETTLTELYALMEVQKNGENGTLLTNGYANIFYVRDVTGTLRAVNASWYDDGWGVYADAVTDPDAWNDDNQVFSRDSRSPLAA